jgi:hypothetical protein
MNQLELNLSDGIDTPYETPSSQRRVPRGIVFLVFCALTWGAVWLVGWVLWSLLRS